MSGADFAVIMKRRSTRVGLAVLAAFAIIFILPNRGTIDVDVRDAEAEQEALHGLKRLESRSSVYAFPQLNQPEASFNRYEKRLRHKMVQVKKCCGALCETREEVYPIDSAAESDPRSKYFAYLKKGPVECRKLFDCPEMDRPSTSRSPPKRIPDFLFSDYSYQGRVPIVSYYHNDMNGAHNTAEWTVDNVNSMRRELLEGKLKGTYGHYSCNTLFRYMRNKVDMKGKRVLVIGSQSPWLEAIVLESGAHHVTTLEYQRITSLHPNISVVLPSELTAQYLNGTLEPFDVIASFSSLEHSGLGRYGDDLNPFGDLMTMGRAWCLLKPGGFGLFGIPVGPDRVEFNSHRVYGKVQLAHFFANWEQIYSEVNIEKHFRAECWFCYQPVFVVKKPE